MNIGIRDALCAAGVLLIAGWIGPAAAQTNAVYLSPIVGIMSVTVPPQDVAGGLQLLGVPFDAEPGNLDQVIGTHGVATSSALTADNVVLFDPSAPPGGQYKRYYLRNNPNEDNRPMWRYAGSPQFWATNVFLFPHDGFWYVNRAMEARTSVFVGDVVEDEVIEQDIVPGLQLLSYPFSASVPLVAIGLTNGVAGTSALAADTITFFDPDLPPSKQYQLYYLRNNPNEDNRPMWRYAGSPQYWATNVVVEPYQGFWYESRQGEPFLWIATRPYSIGDE